MKVSVIGPGAMGSLFAARLSLGGVNTTLVDYKEDRAERLAKSGITVEDESGTVTATPAVTSALPQKQDLIIIFTKAYSTEGLKVPSGIPALTLQNGLGNAETLCNALGSALVLAGNTSEAATYLEEGRIRHAAKGLSKIGAWTTCPTDTAEAALTRAGFSVEIISTPGQAIWEKVVSSAAINTVSSLLDVPNGQLVEISEARMLMRDLVVEATKVASTEGYRFDQSLVELTEDICRNSATNISSMLQDVRAGRRTEIEMISGEIVRRAELALLPTPRTRVITQLIKALEAR